jgi:D-sedoheptulose 7-phosphate isomerase
MSNADYTVIEKIIECLLQARDKDLHIFFIGNGGSAATAAHFAQDLGEVGRKTGAKNFRTICLNDSIPFITALGNDYGYERIFAGQLDNLFKKGDMLVAISASGNSPNILEAVRLAKARKGMTIGLTGFDGGELAKLCDLSLTIKTDKGEYGPVEDAHLILNHMITTYILMTDANSAKKKER